MTWWSWSPSCVFMWEVTSFCVFETDDVSDERSHLMLLRSEVLFWATGFTSFRLTRFPLCHPTNFLARILQQIVSARCLDQGFCSLLCIWKGAWFGRLLHPIPTNQKGLPTGVTAADIDFGPFRCPTHHHVTVLCLLLLFPNRSNFT